MKWIPVEERLPEPNEHVLLFLQNEKKQAQMVGYLFFSENEKLKKCNNEFSAYTGGFPDFLRKEYVLAWMPLPEPYKGGRNE